MAVVLLLGDARRSIVAAPGHSIDEFGPEAAAQYVALIEQAIAGVARCSSAATVRRVGEPRKGQILLRYALVSSQNIDPSGIDRVARPRHFIVARLDGDLRRIPFIAHDSMRPKNVLRRSHRSDVRDADRMLSGQGRPNSGQDRRSPGCRHVLETATIPSAQ